MSQTAQKQSLKFSLAEKKNATEWNYFVDSSIFSSLYQYYEWGDTLKNESLKPVRFLCKDSSEVIIATQGFVSSELGVGKVLYINAGPVFCEKEKFKQSYQFFFENILEFCKKEKCKKIKIRPSSFINITEISLPDSLFPFTDSFLQESLNSFGFRKKGGKREDSVRYFIDLELSEKQLLQQFAPEVIEDVFFSVDNGVEILSYPSEVNGFINKLNELKNLEGISNIKILKNQPEVSVAQMKDNFRGSSTFELFQASLGMDKIETALCHFAAYSAGIFFRQRNPNFKLFDIQNLLTWVAIKEAKKRGCKVFEVQEPFDTQRMATYQLKEIGTFELKV